MKDKKKKTVVSLLNKLIVQSYHKTLSPNILEDQEKIDEAKNFLEGKEGSKNTIKKR